MFLTIDCKLAPMLLKPQYPLIHRGKNTRRHDLSVLTCSYGPAHTISLYCYLKQQASRNYLQIFEIIRLILTFRVQQLVSLSWSVHNKIPSVKSALSRKNTQSIFIHQGYQIQLESHRYISLLLASNPHSTWMIFPGIPPQIAV